MKKILFALNIAAGLTLLSSLSHSQTATITGTLRDFGLSGTRGVIKVMEVQRSGYLIVIPRDGKQVPVSTDGSFRFNLPASIGTDTTKARIFVDVPDWRGQGDRGVWVNLPTGTSHALTSLTPTTYIPSTYPVIVNPFAIVDSTTGLSITTDSLRLGTGLKLIAGIGGSGTPTIISTATGGGGDTTGTTNRPEMTNIETDIANNADSIAAHLARISATEQVADGALPKSDTTALHAQKFKDISDTLTAHKTAIDTKQNVLTAAQIARLDSSLASGYAISITSAGTIRIIAVDTTGFFAAFGGVMTESDPTAIKADTASLAAIGDQIYPRSSGGVPSDSLNWTKAGDLIRPKTGIARVEVPRLVVGGADDVRQGVNIHTNVKADSLIEAVGGVKTPRIQIDTLYSYSVDSLGTVSRTGDVDPRYIGGTDVAAAAYKIGQTTLVFTVADYSGADLTTLAFRSDTANSVEITGVELNVRGGRMDAAGFGGALYYLSPTNTAASNMTVTLWLSTAGNNHASLASAASYIGTKGMRYIRANWSVSANRMALVTATVTYVIPVASASSNPVIITDE